MSEAANRILSNTVYRSVADVGSKIASAALYVVMARKLGQVGFGVFTFGYVVAALATMFGSFGQATILTREVARDRGKLGVYFWNTLALNILLSLPGLAAVALAIGLLGSDRQAAVVIILGLALIMELLMFTCYAAYQAFERLVLMPISMIAQRLTTAIVGMAALFAGASVVVVCVIYLGAAILALALTIRLLYRYVAKPPITIDVTQWIPLLRAAFPLGLFVLFSTALFRADTAMLALYEPKRIVGDYGAAYRLFETTLFIAWGVTAAVYPVLVRLTPTTSPPVGAVWERATKLVIALTLPIAVGAAVLAGPVIEFLYGSNFSGAAPALVLLSPTIALYPIAFICGTALISQNRESVMTRAYAVIAAQNILGNLVLIPLLSLKGAALGTSLSQLLLTTWLVWKAREAVGGRLHWQRIVLGPVLATGVAAVSMLLLRSTAGLAVATGGLAYVLTLTAFEFVAYPEDARVIRDFLARRLVSRLPEPEGPKAP